MCAPWSYRPRFANTDSVISARTAFGSRNLWADIFWCSNQELTGGEARFQLKLENGLFGAGGNDHGRASHRTFGLRFPNLPASGARTPRRAARPRPPHFGAQAQSPPMLGKGAF